MTDLCKRVLALDLRGRQFGFVVLEDESKFLDWGVKSFRQGANAVRVPLTKKVGDLFKQFDPDVLVIKEPTSPKARRVVKRIKNIAKRRLKTLPNSAIRNTFVDCTGNKHKIALSIVAQFPELAPRMPKKRKAWQSEDYRFSIFDAAATCLAYQRHAMNKRDCLENEI